MKDGKSTAVLKLRSILLNRTKFSEVKMQAETVSFYPRDLSSIIAEESAQDQGMQK